MNDKETVKQAYGCLNLITWFTIMAIAGLLAANFFGGLIGWAVALSILLFCLILTGLNAKKALDAES